MKIPVACPKPAKRGPKERAPRKQKTRMKQRNAKRGGHMFPKNVDEAFREWIRAQRCIIWGRRYESRAGGHVLSPPHECHTPVQCCHVKNRGTGGKDRGNCVSMCAWMHDAQHRFGMRSFQSR